MSKPVPVTVGADWTKILADPDIAKHLGTLLQTYRESPPDQRDEALRRAMRQIKGQAKWEASKAKSDGAGTASNSRISTPEPAVTALTATPPFEPEMFKISWGDDRRRHPRMKCFVAVELRVEGCDEPIWGNMSNASLGGCFVETSTAVDMGKKLRIGLWVANGEIWVKGLVISGMVTRTNPSFGMRVKFSDLDAPERETLRQFLQYVSNTTINYQRQDNYIANMKR